MSCDPQEVHANAQAFAAWIAGYQNFYEPIVRAWLTVEGLSPIENRTVRRAEFEPSLAALEAGIDPPRVSPERIEWAIQELRRKSRRGWTQFDLLMQSDKGVVAGEFKSWKHSAGPVTWKLVKDFFVEGDWGLFFYISDIRGQPVVENRLVLWSRATDHDVIEDQLTEIYRRPVRLHYLDEMIGAAGPAMQMEIRDRLRLLDDAIGIVKQAFPGT
jgi:hypothetical protein